MFDWFYLEKDMQTCGLSHEELIRIRDRLVVLENKEDEFSHYEIRELLEKVQLNQLDKIVHGFNYGQKDIIQHLKKLK